MPLALENFDAETRRFMLDEIALAVAAIGASEGLYFSSRLNPLGRTNYPDLLKKAAEQHDEEWLGEQIRSGGLLVAKEPRHLRNGRIIMADVSKIAHETLADGEFNYFYIRALCARAAQSGGQVQVYRAKPVTRPRPESESLIDTIFEPSSLLADLRAHSSVKDRLDLVFKLPPGANSGLSVRLI